MSISALQDIIFLLMKKKIYKSPKQKEADKLNSSGQTRLRRDCRVTVT